MDQRVNYHLLFNDILNKYLYSLQTCSTLHVNVLCLERAVLEDSTGGVGGDGELPPHEVGGRGGQNQGLALPLQAMGVPLHNPDRLHRNSTHLKPFLGYFLGF